MKILIEMGADHYDGFLKQCSCTLPEYTVLKNGFVPHRQIQGEDRRMVAILCDETEAQKLLVTAKRLALPTGRGSGADQGKNLI